MLSKDFDKGVHLAKVLSVARKLGFDHSQSAISISRPCLSYCSSLGSRRWSSTAAGTIKRALDLTGRAIKSDGDLANGLSILERTTQVNILAIVGQASLLSLLQRTLRLAVNEGCLLAFKLCASCLSVATKLKLISLERALKEVTVSEVEATLAEGVLEHEAVKERAILPVLLRLA